MIYPATLFLIAPPPALPLRSIPLLNQIDARGRDNLVPYEQAQAGPGGAAGCLSVIGRFYIREWEIVATRLTDNHANRPGLPHLMPSMEYHRSFHLLGSSAKHGTASVQAPPPLAFQTPSLNLSLPQFWRWLNTKSPLPCSHTKQPFLLGAL